MANIGEPQQADAVGIPYMDIEVIAVPWALPRHVSRVNGGHGFIVREPGRPAKIFNHANVPRRQNYDSAINYLANLQ